MTRIVFDTQEFGTPYDLDQTLTRLRLVGSSSYPAAISGLRGPARTFDGTSGYEAADADSALLGLRAVSVRALCRPDFDALAGTTAALVSRGQGGPLAGEYWAWTLRLTVTVDALSATLEWSWQDETGTDQTHAIGTVGRPADDAWILVSACRETPSDTSYLRGHLDGVDLASTTATDQIPATPGQPVTLGIRKTSGGYDQPYVGDLELVEVLDVATTSLQERHRAAEILYAPDDALQTIRDYWFTGVVPLYGSDYERYRLRPLAALQAEAETDVRRREESGLPNSAYGERLEDWESALDLPPANLTLAERQQRAASAVLLSEGIGALDLLAYAQNALGDPAVTIVENGFDVEVDLSKTDDRATRVVAPAFEEVVAFSEASGRSMAASGDWIAVGESNATVSGFANAGQVHLYERDPVSNAYSYHSTLDAPAPATSTLFGFSVALDGDTLVVGTPGETEGGATFAGAVYVFVYDGASWNQQARVVAGNFGSSDDFGSSVSVSGDLLAVGAPDEDGSGTGIDPADDDLASNAGAAYVFLRTGTSWAQDAYVKSSNTGSNDDFGTAVSIDGDLLVVGAPGEDGNGIGIDPADNDLAANSGAAYVYRRTAGVWAQEAYVKASNTGAADAFGGAVSVSGDTFVVGAPGEDGSGTGIDPGDDNGAGGSGAVYVFRDSSGWAQEAYVKASNTGSSDEFGTSLDLVGDELLVGAPGEDSADPMDQANNSASASGAAYLFLRVGSTWTQHTYVKAASPTAAYQMGTSVAIGTDNFVAAGTLNGTDWILFAGCPESMAGLVPADVLEAARVEGAITAEWDGSSLLLRSPCPAADLTFDPGSDKAGLMEWPSYGRVYVDASIEFVAADGPRGVSLLWRTADEAMYIGPYFSAFLDYRLAAYRWTPDDAASADILGPLPASSSLTWRLIVGRDDAGDWSVRAIGDSDEVTYAVGSKQLVGDPQWLGFTTHGTDSGGDPRMRLHAYRALWTEWPLSFDWTAVAPSSTVRADVGADLLARRNRASAAASYTRIPELLADDDEGWLDYTPTVTL